MCYINEFVKVQDDETSEYADRGITVVLDGQETWFRLLNLLPDAVAVKNVSLNLHYHTCNAYAQFID